MASSSNIRAGRAFVELYVEDKDLQAGLKRAENRLKGFANKSRSITNLVHLRQGFRDLGKVASAYSLGLANAMRKVGTQAKQMGGEFIRLAAVVAAPAVAGIKAFSDFEKQMAEVSTMLDKPAAHMGKFRKEIQDMAVEFGEGTDTLSKGLYDILSASVPAEKALDVLAVAAKAAKAGLTDTGTAADAITTILNSYGLEAERAGEVSDILFATVKRGKTTFGELAPNIGKVASIAANGGVSLDELGASLALLTRNGVQTENAVTAVQAIISSFLKPSEEAAAIARELGFEMNSTALKTEGLEGVFQRISKLPPDAIAKLFPNVRALRGVLPALKNLEGFSGDIEAMAGSAGSTEEAYEKMSKTLSHAMAQAKQAVVQVAVAIGEALAGSVGDWAATIKEAGASITDWVRDHKELVKTVANLAIGVGTLGGALIAFGTAANVMASSILGIRTATLTLGKAFTFLMAHPLVAFFTLAAGAITAAYFATKKLARGMVELDDTADRALASARKQQTEDRKRAKRLEELAGKQKLSNAEVQEAKDLLGELNGRYGDFGITLNKTGDALESTADAMERLNQAMVQRESDKINAAIKGHQKNIRLLGEELEKIGDQWGSFGPWSDHVKQAELAKQQQEEQAKINKLLEERAQLLGRASAGGAPATPSGVSPDVAAAAASFDFEAAERKAKSLADFERQLDEQLHDLRLNHIKDEEKREIARIRHEADKKREELAKLAGETGSLMDVENARTEALVEAYGDTDAQDRINAEYDAKRDAAIANAKSLQKINEEQAEREKAVRDKFLEQNKAEEEEAARDRARSKQQIEDQLARERIESTKSGLDKELALLDLEKKQQLRDLAEETESAIAEAQAKGWDWGKVAADMLGSKKKLLDTFDLREKALKAGGAAARDLPTAHILGTQAEREARLAMGKPEDDTAKKQLDETKKSNKLLDKIAQGGAKVVTIPK